MEKPLLESLCCHLVISCIACGTAKLTLLSKQMVVSSESLRFTAKHSFFLVSLSVCTLSPPFSSFMCIYAGYTMHYLQKGLNINMIF